MPETVEEVRSRAYSLTIWSITTLMLVAYHACVDGNLQEAKKWLKHVENALDQIMEDLEALEEMKKSEAGKGGERGG